MDLGKKIRLLRKRQNRTLDEVANQCGFTKSLLSKIENGRTMPPIATMMKIAGALGVKMSDLLDDNHDQGTVYTKAEEHASGEAWIATNKGYSFFPFAASRDKIMQPYLFHAKKGEVKEHLLSHEGEEFIYMLEGTMKYRIGSVEYTLGPGESVYFHSLEEHALTPITDEVRYLAVFSQRSETD
jgi:transcriptional regulator with XRE-family HTH domain